MKYLLYPILFLFALKASAQDISGIYTGTLTNDSLKMIQSYQLALSEYRGKITGYSYITFVTNDTFYYGIKRIKANRIKGELVVEDVEMLVNNYPQRPDKGVHVINIIPLPQGDSILNLNGIWKTTQTKKYGFYSISGDLRLKKDNDSANSALISHLKELNIIKTPEPQKVPVAKAKEKVKVKKVKEEKPAVAEVKPLPKAEPVIAKAVSTSILPEQRNVRTIETVTTFSDSLVLSFYDNGVVDGDTISVYLNERNILSKAKLTEAASKKVVYTNEQNIDEYKLTLIAENLGSIPPNTGLVIIQDGDQKYQIRFSADMQNNASIIIRKGKK